MSSKKILEQQNNGRIFGPAAKENGFRVIISISRPTAANFRPFGYLHPPL